jgi:hypothetical protein
MRSRYGFLAFYGARATSRRRKVRIDADANYLFASLGEELVFLAAKIQTGGSLLEEERLLWRLRGEQAHQIVAGGRRGVVSWWHDLTIRDIEV